MIVTTTTFQPQQSLSKQHTLLESLFCKLRCSQTYSCLRMVIPLSVQLLANNFASRILAILNRSENRKNCGELCEELFGSLARSISVYNIHGRHPMWSRKTGTTFKKPAF